MKNEIDVPDISLTPDRIAMDEKLAQEEKEEYERQIKIDKKSIKLKRITATSILIAGVALSVVAKGSWQRRQGEAYICDKYALSGLDISVRDDSTAGLVVVMNGSQVSLEEAVSRVGNVVSSEYPEISQAEKKIVLENILSGTLDEFFPNVSKDEVSKIKEAAYHEMNAYEINKGVVSK